MSSIECAFCGTPITEQNDSKEHLIANAIGGRKKISGFLCKVCNSISGKDWDAELAKQLNPLSLFFGIIRERGEVPSQIVETTKGDRLQYNPDGRMSLPKPEYKEESLGAGVQISIKARSLKEARQMLAGIRRKYPKIETNGLLQNAKRESFYSKDMLKFSHSFGGHKVGRALVKSAFGLAVAAGVNPKSCENAINYLTKENSEACFGYFYERDLIKNRPDGVVFHCVAVNGNLKTRQLLGYVEYYGVRRMIISLSDSYDGQEFSNVYAIDPISGNEIALDVDLSLTPEEVKAAYRYEKIPPGSVESAFKKVILIGLEKAFEKEKNRAITEAVEYAIKNCGAAEGELLTEDHTKKLIGLIMEKLEPYLMHHTKDHSERR